jgi:hypothetical protein
MASNGFQFRGECASNVVVVLEMHSKDAPWSDIPHGSPSLSWHYNMMEQVRTSNFMAVLPLIQVVLVFIPKLSTATWESNIRRSHTAGQGAQSIWGEWCTKYAKDRSRPWHHLQDGTISSVIYGRTPGIGDLGIWQPLNGWSSGRGILGAAKSPKLVDTSKAMKILNKSMGDLQDPKTEVR